MTARHPERWTVKRLGKMHNVIINGRQDTRDFCVATVANIRICRDTLEHIYRDNRRHVEIRVCAILDSNQKQPT